MGSAFTAVADDATAIYWNPAGISLMNRSEADFTHSDWLLGTNYDFLGYAQPTRFGSLGVGVTRLSDGQIEGRGADRSQAGGFTAADTAYALGYSRVLAGANRLGMSVKYITSQIGSDVASTFAADFGALRSFDRLPLSVGISVQNLGPGLRYLNQSDPLPMAVTAGGAYRLAGALHIALDVKYEPYARQTSISLGSEYTIFSALALRAGYSSGSPATQVGTVAGSPLPLAGLGWGIGLRLGGYTADYTITPFGELGNVQRISLGARFGSEAVAPAASKQSTDAAQSRDPWN